MTEIKSTGAKILQPGRNCWRLVNADRVCFLIDGDDYFCVLRQTVERARRDVFILGWDLDSRFELQRDKPDHTAPMVLGKFFRWALRRRPALQLYILSWDFSLFMSAHREWWPAWKLGGATHRRMHVQLDDQHPLGACHHQKVVVVDDRVAFAGGLDLTLGRWDTQEHLPDDPRRVGPGGKIAQPYHDVQMMVSGEAATALGDLARERWQNASGQQLDRANLGKTIDPWPEGLTPDIRNVRIGIARTRPDFGQLSEVREIEQLNLDAIAAARHTIYIENQYLTCDKVGAALVQRLTEEDGPQVILVLPIHTDGWIARQTMDLLRVELIKKLRKTDLHNRLRVYYPYLPGANAEQQINVHAKVMVIDDRLLRIGSANLNNRSMGLDTECDLALEAGDNVQTSLAIAHFRNRLLAEHLDVTSGQIAVALTDKGSLIAAIESLLDSERSLRDLEPEFPETSAPLLDDARLADPDRPLEAAGLLRRLVPKQHRRSAGRQIFWWSVLLTIFLLLAATWHWIYLDNRFDVTLVMTALDEFHKLPLMPIWVIGLFVVAGLLAVPLTGPIVLAVLVFGPWTGFIYAYVGAAASAVCGYILGAVAGFSALHRLFGKRLDSISRELTHRGIIHMIVMRVVPQTPFPVINLAAGALRIRLRDFLIGTLAGMIPGIVAVVILADRLSASLHSPGLFSFLSLMFAALLIGAIALFLSRRLFAEAHRKTASERPPRNLSR